METNVVIIMCDTLRQDMLGVYGGIASTPNLDSFVKDSVIYKNAIAPAPWTFPSHVSLFSGLYSNEHKVHETKEKKLLDLASLNSSLKVERLPEILKNRGYFTFGISNNPMVSPVNNFDIGFDLFHVMDTFPTDKSSKIFADAKSLGATPSRIAFNAVKKGQILKIFEFYNWWRKNKKTEKFLNFPLDKGARETVKFLKDSNWNNPFFLFINLLEVHEPYIKYKSIDVWKHTTGIKEINPKALQNLKFQYKTEIEYLDKKIGEIVALLKYKNIYDNSLIIVTADHGQAFNEHGEFFHGVFLYDELIRIPLIIKYPNSAKFDNKSGYQSLVNIKDLILNIIEGGDDSKLTNDTAFSESYGLVSLNLPGGFENKKDYMVNTYEKVRKAVYKNGFKLIVNGTEGVIEEFLIDNTKADPNKNKEVVREMLNELEIFKGKETFSIPLI